MNNNSQNNNTLDFFKLIKILWAGKKIIIWLITLTAISSVSVSLYLTPIFRAETILIPVEKDKAIGSQLGQAAGFLGINMPGGGSKTDEAIAVMKSKEFLIKFIKENNVLQILYADIWDEKSKLWTVENAKVPSMLDAYEDFNKLQTILQDTTTSLVTFSLDWTDAALATHWTNKLVEALNARMREKAIIKSEKNLTYLEYQLTKTQMIEVKRSIYQLIENEMKNMVYANAQEEYTFEVIDPALQPEKKNWPKRSIIVLTSIFFAGILGSLIVISQYVYRHRKGSV